MHLWWQLPVVLCSSLMYINFGADSQINYEPSEGNICLVTSVAPMSIITTEGAL